MYLGRYPMENLFVSIGPETVKNRVSSADNLLALIEQERYLSSNLNSRSRMWFFRFHSSDVTATPIDTLPVEKQMDSNKWLFANLIRLPGAESLTHYGVIILT